MTYRLIAGRLRSTGWEKHSSPLLTRGLTGEGVPVHPVVDRWERTCFRCHLDFAHLVPDREPAPFFGPYTAADFDYPTGP